MPNWCFNALEVVGNTENLKRFIQDNTGYEVFLDFSKSIPLQSYENPKEAWGCREPSKDAVSLVLNSGSAMYLFDTPWTPPIQWLIKTSTLYPSLTFHLEYEEGGEELKGKIVVNNGKVVN